MRKIVTTALAVLALFAGALSTSGGATARDGHKVDVVCPGSCYEIDPAPGDMTVNGWTWGE